MFEPIHYDLRETGVHISYLGSTAGVDLWLDGDGDLRVVAGAGNGWDYFVVREDNTIERVSLDVDLDFKKLAMIKRYLKTFVPDLYARAQALRAERKHADGQRRREDIDME